MRLQCNLSTVFFIPAKSVLIFMWNGHTRMPSCLLSPTGNQSLVNNVRMYVSPATLVLILFSYCLTVFTLFSSFIRICWASSNLFHIWLNYLKIIAAKIPFGNWWITLKRRSGIIILNMFFPSVKNFWLIEKVPFVRKMVIVPCCVGACWFYWKQRQWYFLDYF